MKPEIRIKGDESLYRLLPAQPHARQTWECFESPEQAVRAVCAVPVSQWWNQVGRDSGRGTDSFAGCSWEQALDFAAHGWQEGAARVARLRDKIVAQAPQRKQLAHFAVAGALPSVPRFLAGNPQAMQRFADRATKTRPVITLINNGGGNCNVRAEVFVNRAAVVAALVDVIEAAGYSVHVIDTIQCQEGSYLFGMATTVKLPGEQPDLARLAFSLGHCGWFRRFGFAVMGYESDNKPLCSWLGHAADFPEAHGQVATYVLPSMSEVGSQFRSEQEAEACGLEGFIARLRDQGCPAFSEREGQAA